MLSSKKDGVRCLIPPAGVPTGYSNLPIPNPRFRTHFWEILRYATAEDIIIDGEIWSSTLTFQEIYSITSTWKSGGKIIPGSIKLYVFEILTREEWESNNPYTVGFFRDRYIERIRPLEDDEVFNLVPLNQELVADPESAKFCLDVELRIGGEGCMLRDPKARYKWGRHTLKENELLKLKFIDFSDAVVIGVVQQERMDENRERRKVEALGALVARDKQGVEFNVGSGFDERGGDKCRWKLWQQRDSLIGRWFKFKSQSVGVKDRPRQPIFISWRDTK